MKTIAILLILTLCLTCRYEEERLEEFIKFRVKSDGASLVQASAMFGIIFTATKGNTFFADDVYIRRDSASVFYGYPLKDAKIAVRDGRLVVSLPEPKRIAINKYTQELNTNDTSFNPTDKTGAAMDIDAEINAKLEILIGENEGKSTEMSKKISQQYFEALANSYGLDLELTFSEPAKLEVNANAAEE